jgi:hypothetical protein
MGVKLDDSWGMVTAWAGSIVPFLVMALGAILAFQFSPASDRALLIADVSTPSIETVQRTGMDRQYLASPENA